MRNIVLAIVGVLALGISEANASLIINGGFESGLAGWTCVAVPGACGTGTQGSPAVEGVAYFWGFDNAPPAGELEQSFLTVAGDEYRVSLIFNTNGSVPPNSLSIAVGDLSTILALAQGTWTGFTGTFTASSATTTLGFLFTTVGGSGTVWIDDVVVERVPEPATVALLGIGLAGLVRARRRK